MNKWDQRFLRLAKEVASWSKDPSSKVGAVIVRPDKTIVSLGFNGFPRGAKDCEENLINRERKLAQTIHAELNAVISARGDTRGNIIYIHPFQPCAPCAAVIKQSGLESIVYSDSGGVPDRWAENFAIARELLYEVGVEYRIVKLNQSEGDT